MNQYDIKPGVTVRRFLEAHLADLFGIDEGRRNISERLTSVHYFILVYVPGAIAFAAIDYFIGNLLIATILALSALVLGCCWRWFSAEQVNITELLVMHAATALALGLLYDGGMLKAGIYWVMLYPFLAFFIRGQRRGWKWIITLLLIILLSIVLQKYQLITFAYENERLIYFLGVFFFYTLLAAGLNLIRARYERLLELEVDEKSRTAMGYLKRLEYLALYDALTDLPNRNLLKDRIAQAIERAKRRDGSFALGLIDVEHFNEINTLLGEGRADEVLKMLAKRLSQSVRGIDTVARLEGDEFLVIWNDVDEATVSVVVQKILQGMEATFELEDANINVSIRLGVVIYPQHGDSVSSLLQHARTVHRRVKRERIHHLVYRSEWHTEAMRQIHLLTRMKEAIHNQDMELVYQPQVSLETGALQGVEALLRWHDPEDGYISPAEFIPLAERSPLIEELTFMTLEQAARQDMLWRRQGLHLQVSVNLSARNLIHKDLPEKVAQYLCYYDAQPCNFVLEITETDIMGHPELALQVMNRLTEMGIRLSIDDFGTGYSSLSYLRKLPVSELKIDQSFIRGYMNNESDQKIVSTIYSLAHALGLSVVAEGVEDEQTLKAIQELGIEYAQGYLVSQPLKPDELLKWARERLQGAATDQ